MTKRLTLLAIMIISSIGLVIPYVNAYTIDGSLSDWGVDLLNPSASNVGYLDTHLPSGGTVDYITEDNASNHAVWQFVGPGLTYYNYFDVEAMYFDNDSSNAYIAIVTGLPKEGYDAPNNPPFAPGDIAIDLGSGYTYGIDVSSFDSITGQANLLAVSNWNNVYYSQFSAANPWTISSGTLISPVSFVYSGIQYSHYVLEASIPLAYLGLSANPGDPTSNITIHWTMQCGNDVLDLRADVNPTPEPSTLFLLGSGLIGIMGFGRKRSQKGK